MATQKTFDGHITSGYSGKNSRLLLRSPRSLFTCILIALLVSSLGVLLGSGSYASAHTASHADGYVYVLNNNLSGSNSITVFIREEDGSLKLSNVTSIGGLGNLPAFSDGTQGSLILTHDEGTRLFAVDAGSDQISVVNVHNGHLSPVGLFSSGGSGPVSLSYHDGLLYVLNAANASTAAANIAGFHVDDNGTLQPIAGATKPLSAAHPNPAQIQIDPTGQFLVVTEKATNVIDIYHIRKNGSLSDAAAFSSIGVFPFGMAFNPTRPGELIVDDGFGVGGKNPTGAVTAYDLEHGKLHLINGPVPDYQIAPCWMVITRNGHFAYTSNADSHTISGYSINEDGAITLLTANGATGVTPPDTFPLEEGLSRDNHFLYSLDSRLLLTPPGPATLSGFSIHPDGSLTSVVDSSQIVLPFSTIGLASE